MFMGQAEPPKCKLSKVPLEISGMFSVQSISYFPAHESCDNKEYFPLLTTSEDRDGGRIHRLPGDGW